MNENKNKKETVSQEWRAWWWGTGKNDKRGADTAIGHDYITDNCTPIVKFVIGLSKKIETEKMARENELSCWMKKCREEEHRDMHSHTHTHTVMRCSCKWGPSFVRKKWNWRLSKDRWILNSNWLRRWTRPSGFRRFRAESVRPGRWAPAGRRESRGGPGDRRPSRRLKDRRLWERRFRRRILPRLLRRPAAASCSVATWLVRSGTKPAIQFHLNWFNLKNSMCRLFLFN